MVTFACSPIIPHTASLFIVVRPIRLVGGRGPHEGRVEVFLNGEWGTVCHDYWDLDNAQVVCRQLGYQGAATAHHSAHFGRGTGRIWLDNVRCTGRESRLDYCSHSKHTADCDHGDDAGVVCGEYMFSFCFLSKYKYFILKVTSPVSSYSGYHKLHIKLPIYHNMTLYPSSHASSVLL